MIALSTREIVVSDQDALSCGGAGPGSQCCVDRVLLPVRAVLSQLDLPRH